jgi:MYXO-CTERM domain-containing protein
MSSTTSLVKELLDQKSTLKGRRSGTETGGDSPAVTKSDVEQAVREGVSEALAEHERTYHDEAVDEPTGDDLEADQSSGGGSSKKGLLLLVVIVAYLVRRRRGQDGSDGY